MRGKLTDQDLTNYALNELDAHERLYVESMLAVSVECRNDVYEMLEMSRMLEEGFEREARRVPADLTLSGEQRSALVRPRRRRAAMQFLHRTAATLAMAACVAFALVNTQMWREEGKVAEVSSQVKQYMTQAVSPSTEDVDISSFVSIEQLAEDSSDWLKAAADSLPQPAVICTPPSWLEGSDLSDLH